jgi:aldose 1-epimerase
MALPSLDRHPFGVLAGGESVELFTLANGNGLTVELLSFGGILHRILATGRDGTTANIVLGLPSLDDYVHRNRPHFGALIGRLANRLANGSFVLDGLRCQIDTNDGPNSLHGGSLGFDKRLWQVAELLTDPDWCSVVLEYTSEAGEMGFPGRLTVLAGYTLTTDGVLRIEYTAETDAPTVVNLTNHSYWNLAGEGSGTIDDHIVTLAADAYTPVDGTLLPTGAIEPVAGTPLDFTRPASIGERLDDDFEQLHLAGGYDFNYVLDRPDATSLVHAATLQEPASGRELSIWTTEPGIQLYSGNHLDGTLTGTGGSPHVRRAGVAFETQHFPDSPNHANFPSTIVRPGQTFLSKTVYTFGVTP